MHTHTVTSLISDCDGNDTLQNYKKKNRGINHGRTGGYEV